MIINARITEIDVGNDGGRIYSVLTPSGQLLEGVMTLGEGGDATIFHHTPYSIGSEVIVISTNPMKRPPYFIIGGVTDPIDRQKIGAVDVPFTQGGDYTTISPSDMAFRNKKSGVVLAQDGLALTSNGINAQLRGGDFRVSQGGLAENRLLNASGTISTLISYFEKVNLKVEALSEVVTKSTELTIAVSGLPATATEVARLSSELAVALATLNTSPPLTPIGSIEADLEASINSSILVP